MSICTQRIVCLKFSLKKPNDITLSSVTFEPRIHINNSQLNCDWKFKINNLQENEQAIL